ncbi:MAG: hypothetical protein H0T59_05670 [Chloroflexi bacterium]|nr:hypothetical protein [Chloroflexota bacterium]
MTGTAHRNAGQRVPARPADASDAREASGRAGETRAAGGDPDGATVRTGRGPSTRTVIPAASNPTTTVPSWSVRSTRALAAVSRSIVALVGWPYGLPDPAEATASRGRTASTNAWVVAVRLP